MKNKLNNAINAIVLTAIVLLLLWGVMTALASTSENQSVMLCNSAQKSGNEEWLERCDTFYKTNNPLDIR